MQSLWEVKKKIGESNAAVLATTERPKAEALLAQLLRRRRKVVVLVIARPYSGGFSLTRI